MKKKHWYDHLWIWTICYFILGYFNILFTGWRIDYFVVSERLMERVKDSCIHSEVMGSDHCPVSLILG